jgi:hypothetical protein
MTISELTPITLTRKRGLDAFRALLVHLEHEKNVDIDLDDAIMMSMSFLDELIWRLAEANLLSRVAFVTRKAGTRRKLGNVAFERNVDVYSRSSVNDRRNVAVPRVSMRTPVPRAQKS